MPRVVAMTSRTAAEVYSATGATVLESVGKEIIDGAEVIYCKAFKAFNADEPRDQSGKWTDGGGAAATSRPERAAPTDDEVHAVERYTGSGFVDVNALLRSGKIDVGESYSATAYSDAYKIIDGLDRLLARASIPQDTTVYRGLYNTGWGAIHGDDLKPGDIISDQGYVSTTTKADVIESKIAKNFYVLEIHMPKGFAAINVAPLSLHPAEKEVLIKRGSRFRVVSHEGHVVRLEAMR